MTLISPSGQGSFLFKNIWEKDNLSHTRCGGRVVTSSNSCNSNEVLINDVALEIWQVATYGTQPFGKLHIIGSLQQ